VKSAKSRRKEQLKKIRKCKEKNKKEGCRKSLETKDW
jgi:hypothetical protein